MCVQARLSGCSSPVCSQAYVPCRARGRHYLTYYVLCSPHRAHKHTSRAQCARRSTKRLRANFLKNSTIRSCAGQRGREERRAICWLLIFFTQVTSGLEVELKTNLREVFTITENAPTRALTWLKAATTIVSKCESSHRRFQSEEGSSKGLLKFCEGLFLALLGRLYDMSVVFGGLTARAVAVMVMAADSIAELCMNVCRLCAALVACCAVCTTVPHHCDDVFVCRVWVHVSPPPPPPPALQPDICSGSSPGLCSRLSVTQCNECGEPGAGAAGAGWAVLGRML